MFVRKIRAYVDTSVFGGTQDEEFADPSCRFFERVHRCEFIVLLSTETLREIIKAPEAVRAVWQALPPDAVEVLSIDVEIEDLAEEYIGAQVLSHNSRSDALHVASATVASADLILSWNFKHIVNFDRIRGFNSVNVAYGYRTMTILSPLEV